MYRANLAVFSSTMLMASIVLAGTVFAAEPPPPPTLSQSVDDDTIPSSVPKLGDNTDVTIIQKKDATIEEVRVKGKLRYAKITPTKGKPYYLYDSDGDGILDATENDIKKANINQWILMEW